MDFFIIMLAQDGNNIILFFQVNTYIYQEEVLKYCNKGEFFSWHGIFLEDESPAEASMTRLCSLPIPPPAIHP